MMRHRLFFLACALLSPTQATQAQINEDADPDSLLSYELGEIVVEGGDRQRTPSTATMHRIALADLARVNAASIDRVLLLIPAAHVQTNSRGETLVYVRNAGERQVAVFFDGALLNVPWDNRVDLSLIPAPVIGSINVAKGVPSVLYGTNVLGGALNLTTRSLNSPGTYSQATGLLGTPGAVQAQLTHLGRTERMNYAFSAGYAENDGLPIPNQADLPFSQRNGDLRTNTDQRLFNLFAQAGYPFSGGQWGLALLHLDGEKGVAPEGHLDPDQSTVRYWRYPDWRTSMAILNGQVSLGPRGGLIRTALWATRFHQTIAQFRSVDYDALGEEQENDDDTFGARLTILQPTGPGELRLALNALTARHRQHNEPFEDDGTPAQTAEPTLSFRQHIWSVGAEYTWLLNNERLELMLGTSLDGIATPATGDKPKRDPQIDVGVTSGLHYTVDDAWTLRAAAGRKVRFPTMRELFGEALGRFLVNPDLTAESSLLAEVGLRLAKTDFSGEIVAFLNRTFDAIDQRSVQVPGEDRPRRQRVNLDGSRVAGVEVGGAARPARGWSAAGHLTWMHGRAFEDGTTLRLVEKPEWVGTLTLTYNHPGGLSALCQGVLNGGAYGLGEDNALQPLSTSLVLNARVGYLFLQGPFATEVYARVNNATDTVTLPQLGLPGPGLPVRDRPLFLRMIPANTDAMRTGRLLLLLGFGLLSGCGPASDTAPEEPAAPAIPADTLNLDAFFKGLEGTFVLWDAQTGRTHAYNPQRARQRFLPASTFKIPNALIALETGVASGPDFLLARDSVAAPRQAWWPASWLQDQTLQSAFQNSVYWYYQILARRIGPERMQAYLHQFAYGNEDLSGGIDTFWLEGGLRISPEEQVAFLQRFYYGELGLSDRTTALVKDIMVLKDTLDYRLSGKTGTAAVTPTRELGWLVGYVEQGPSVYIYALNMEGETVWEQWPPHRRVELVQAILQTLDVWPQPR